METRAPIQSDSDTLRDGIENESFDRNNSNAEIDSSSQITNQNSTPNDNESERVLERSTDSENEGDRNSQASNSDIDSTSTYSNDPKTTIEVTTINIPVQDHAINQSETDTENV